MKIFLVCLLCCCVSGIFIDPNTFRIKPKGCSRPPPDGKIPSKIQSLQPWKYVKSEDLPNSFDWRWKDSRVMVTPIQNQFMPKFCGSCWAFSTTSSVSDRFKIAYNASMPDIMLSPQVLLDCGDVAINAGSCDGGTKDLAFQFMNEFGITDLTCAPYMAVDYQFMSELPCQETMCRTCDRFGTCGFVANPKKYYVEEYGDIPTLDVDAMMMEIYVRGPIVCSMYAHSESFENYSGGIITDPTVYNETTHDISLVGWGEEGGISYWIGRNSFGTLWGEMGWFRIERGTNCLLIESSCSWATPLL